MKKTNTPVAALLAALLVVSPLGGIVVLSQQTTAPAAAMVVQQQKRDAEQTRPRTTTTTPATPNDPAANTAPLDTRIDNRVKTGEAVIDEDDAMVVSEAAATDGGVAPDVQSSKRRPSPAEDEAGIVPYYNNFMTTYRLGPEDIISVSVFGQERYSRGNIVVPPDGVVAYPLVPEGILVVGKTTRQVAKEITQKLDEYIIDPKVTVSLEKAQSARYSVLGDVGQPGIRLMTRRLSVYEAVAEAGGVLTTGDKSKVFVLRRQADGQLAPIRVNVASIEKGKALDNIFLAPGDQVVVPGNKLKKFQQIVNLFQVVSFARIFTGGW